MLVLVDGLDIIGVAFLDDFLIGRSRIFRLYVSLLILR